MQPAYFRAYRSVKLARDAQGVLVAGFHSNGMPLTFTAPDHKDFVEAFYRISQDRENKIVILMGAGGEFIPGIDFSSTARTAGEWGVVAEVVPNGEALARARELATLYLKAPDVTRRNTRAHFIQRHEGAHRARSQLRTLRRRCIGSRSGQVNAGCKVNATIPSSNQP